MAILRRITISLALLFIAAAGVFAQHISHEVKQGETLYKISKQYGVTVSMILEKNKWATTSALHPGDKLLIPSFEAEQPKPMKQHKVKRRETLYGITRLYGITVDQLAEANPQIMERKFKLKRGMMLNIPEPRPIADPAAENVQNKGTAQPDKGILENDEKDMEKKVRVAVLLPLKSTKGEGERSIEFYRGMLMAAEQFKKNGANIEIRAYDEGTATSDITTALQDVENMKADVLVGPVYPAHFNPVSDFSKRTGIRVVVPFSSKVEAAAHTPKMYLLNMPKEREAQEVCRLIEAHTDAPHYVFLNYAHGNKKDFAKSLYANLGNCHADTVSTEYPAPWSDIKALLASGKENILIPNSSSEETLKELLILLNNNGGMDSLTTITLMGYPEWADHLMSHPEERDGKRVCFFTSNQCDWSTPGVTKFKSQYAAWFSTELLKVTPRMGLLGFDCAANFFKGILRHGENYENQTSNVSPLQTPFKFERTNAGGGWTNANIWLMRFDKDGSLVKLSF